VLPHTALITGDPRLFRILILFGCTTDTSNDFFGFLLWLWRSFLSFLIGPFLWNFEGLVELLQRLVLAFGGTRRSTGFWFCCCLTWLAD
jgi:hypothetical protein